jgi:hypothetical protein
MIISTEDGMISWHKLLLPEVLVGTEGQDYKMTVTEDLDKEYKFEAG